MTKGCRNSSVRATSLGRVRQIHPDRGPLALLADDLEPAAVAQRDMLGDGEAEPGAADRPAAAGVDPVEALGEPGNMLGRDPLALVDDADAQQPAAGFLELDPHRRAGAAVIEGV